MSLPTDFLINIICLVKKSPNDANELNREFYYELLYIMGLIEKDNILVKSDTKNSLLDITEEMIGTEYYLLKY